MKKIYLSGYYGQSNLGDDYIFYSILDQLGNLDQNISLNVEIGSSSFEGKVYEKLANRYKKVVLKYTFIHGIRGKINKLFSLIQTNYWIIGGVAFSRQKMCQC